MTYGDGGFLVEGSGKGLVLNVMTGTYEKMVLNGSNAQAMPKGNPSSAGDFISLSLLACQHLPTTQPQLMGSTRKQ